MTTNCIVEPRPAYRDRIFTTGEVGWSGVPHVDGKLGQTKDYSKVIEKALVSKACLVACRAVWLGPWQHRKGGILWGRGQPAVRRPTACNQPRLPPACPPACLPAAGAAGLHRGAC